MNPELATCAVMAFCCLSAGLLDWALARWLGERYTMTAFIRRVTLHNMWLEVTIILALGLLIGHFFLWPDCPAIQEELRQLKEKAAHP